MLGCRRAAIGAAQALAGAGTSRGRLGGLLEPMVARCSWDGDREPATRGRAMSNYFNREKRKRKADASVKSVDEVVERLFKYFPGHEMPEEVADVRWAPGSAALLPAPPRLGRATAASAARAGSAERLGGRRAVDAQAARPRRPGDPIAFGAALPPAPRLLPRHARPAQPVADLARARQGASPDAPGLAAFRRKVTRPQCHRHSPIDSSQELLTWFPLDKKNFPAGFPREVQEEFDLNEHQLRVLLREDTALLLTLIKQMVEARGGSRWGASRGDARSVITPHEPAPCLAHAGGAAQVGEQGRLCRGRARL